MVTRTPHPPKIYWLTEAFFPPSRGGQQLIAAHLVHGLISRGAKSCVITRQTEPLSAVQERLSQLTIYRLPPAGVFKGKGWRALLPMLRFLKNLLFLLMSHVRHYDIIIVSGAKTMPLVAVLVSRIWHKKCVLRVETPMDLYESISTGSLHSMNRLAGRMLLKVFSGIQQCLFKRVDCFIAISPEINEALAARGIPPRQIQEIPNGIDFRTFHPVSTADKLKLRQKLSIPHDQTVFIYTGRLSAAKGLPLLIEVWSTLIVQYPDIYLVILGSSVDTFDTCEEYLHAYIQTHQLMASVTLAGTSDRVDEYLQAADVFVFPSEYEGFGLSIIEAMACGLPVVVTPVGVARELIEHGKNGFVFPVNNKHALLRALVFALEQRERWPMITQAARQSITPYDLQVVIDQYMILCCELLSAAAVSSKDSQV